jgi:hypothetical protein
MAYHLFDNPFHPCIHSNVKIVAEVGVEDDSADVEVE